MYFESLQALLSMDGHGVYVWTAYLVTIATIAFVMIAPVRRRKRFIANLAATLKRTPGPQGGTGEDR